MTYFYLAHLLSVDAIAEHKNSLSFLVLKENPSFKEE
jgi:hypothetical protein